MLQKVVYRVKKRQMKPMLSSASTCLGSSTSAPRARVLLSHPKQMMIKQFLHVFPADIRKCLQDKNPKTMAEAGIVADQISCGLHSSEAYSGVAVKAKGEEKLPFPAKSYPASLQLQRRRARAQGKGKEKISLASVTIVNFKDL